MTLAMTTTARVGALRSNDVEAGSADEALITQLIASVSSLAERYMNRTVLTTTYTDVDFELRQFKKHYWLPAWPISAVTSLKYAAFPSDLAAATAVDTDLYHVDSQAGTLRLMFATPYDPGFIRLTYTGGMATTTAAFIAAYPEISDAIDMEIINIMQRARTPDGDVQFRQGGVKYQSTTRLLPRTREVLDAYARVLW